MTPQRLAAATILVERSCAAQGLPPVINDPSVLERVAAIFRLDQDATCGRQERSAA